MLSLFCVCLFFITLSKGVVIREISPESTNSSIQGGHDHIVFPGPKNHDSFLLVHLHGEHTYPTQFEYFLTTAYDLNYYVIGLSYSIKESLFLVCHTHGDSCYNQVLWETISGQDTSKFISVSPANSINNRLFSLLNYLHSNYPSEGWDSFINGSLPDWSKTRLSGFRQGADLSISISKHYPVYSVVSFSGPIEYDNGNWVSDSTTAAWKTDLSRYTGLIHVQDADCISIQSMWKDLGLSKFGDYFRITAGDTPKDFTSQYCTTTAPRVFGAESKSTLMDDYTPLVNNKPVYTAVWKKMLGSSIDSAPPSERYKSKINECACVLNPLFILIIVLGILIFLGTVFFVLYKRFHPPKEEEPIFDPDFGYSDDNDVYSVN